VEVEEEGEISFLKETQWQVPFSVTTAQERPMARLVSTAALVHAAPSTTAVVAAPVDGLLSWTDGLPVVGRMVERGERVATLIPAGAAEHWSGLQADMSTARVDRDLAAQELTRVEALAERDLLSERRLHEARASVERADAQLGATQRRVAALTSGSAGAMPVRAPASGLVVAVGAEHGTAVSTGSPLISVAAGTGVLIEAHVHDRALTELSHVASLSVLRGDWSAPKDLFAHGGRLLTERLVFDAHTLSAPLLAAVGGDVGLVPGDVVELQVGVGESTPRLAVPRSAIVEVNSQDLLFVQKTGETFARRRVVLGVADPTHVEVKSGLEVGERVVTIGGFDVHVASMSSQLESHRH
jgi:RND family efflux transporter MFP subunit